MKLLLTMSLLTLISCASLSEQGRAVKVIDISAIKSLKGCKHLGSIIATPGTTFGGAKAKNLLIKLKNKVGKLGGNAVLTKDLITGGSLNVAPVLNKKIKGRAYKCSSKSYSSIDNVSEL